MHEKVNGIALNFEEILSVGYIDITVKFCGLSPEQLPYNSGARPGTGRCTTREIFVA